MNNEDKALDLGEFTDAHGSTVTNALQVYVDRMREAVREFPSNSAYPRAFTEAADKAEAALRAWEKLTEGDDDAMTRSPGES